MLRLNVTVDIIQTVGFTLGEGDGMNVSVGLIEGERDGLIVLLGSAEGTKVMDGC
jgi:hypothetical protein